MPDVDSRLKHDSLVIRHAVRLVSEGWSVKARVPDWYEEPDVIAGYRPDILAQKGDRFLIVEVKKGEVDHPKIVALERFVNERPNYRLQLIDLEDSAVPAVA